MGKGTELIERLNEKKTNTSSQDGVYYNALPIEDIHDTEHRYVDDLVHDANENVRSAYARERVALKDAIAAKLTWIYQARAWSKYPKFYLSDELGAPEIMQRVRMLLQQIDAKNLFITHGALKQINGWAVTKCWIQDGKLKKFIFSENQCNYSNFIRDNNDPLNVLGFRLHKRPALPYDRPSLINSSEYYREYLTNEDGLIYTTRGDPDSSFGFGYGILQSCWDAITKLRLESHANAFKSSLFSVIRVPPNYDDTAVDNLVKAVDSMDQRKHLVLRMGVETPEKKIVPNAPSIELDSFVNPTDKAKASEGAAAGASDLGSEFTRMCIATGHTASYFVGAAAQAGSMASGEVDFSSDATTDIEEFSYYDADIKAFINLLMRWGLISPAEVPPSYTVKCHWQWERDEFLIQQALMMEQQAEQQSNMNESSEIRMNRPGPKSKKEKAAEDRFVGLRHASGQKSSIGKGMGMVPVPSQAIVPMSITTSPLPQDQAIIPAQPQSQAITAPTAETQGTEGISMATPKPPTAAPLQASKGGFGPNQLMDTPMSDHGPSQVAFGDKGLILNFPGKDPYFYPTEAGLADAPPPVLGQDPITPQQAQQAAQAAMSGNGSALHQIIKGNIPGKDFARQPAPGNETKTFPHAGFSHQTRYTAIGGLDPANPDNSGMPTLQTPPKGSWSAPGYNPDPGTDPSQKTTTLPPTTPYQKVVGGPKPGASVKVGTDFSKTLEAEHATKIATGQPLVSNPYAFDPASAAGTPSSVKPVKPGGGRYGFGNPARPLITGTLRDAASLGRRIFQNEAYDPTAELPNLLIRENGDIMSISQAARELHHGKDWIYKEIEKPLECERANQIYEGNSFSTKNAFIYLNNGSPSVEYQCPDAIKLLIGKEVPIIISHKAADSDRLDPKSNDLVIGKYKITGWNEQDGHETAEYNINEDAVKAVLDQFPDYKSCFNADGTLSPEAETSTAYKCNVHYDHQKRRKIQKDFELHHLAIVKRGNCSKENCPITPKGA